MTRPGTLRRTRSAAAVAVAAASVVLGACGKQEAPRPSPASRAITALSTVRESGFVLGAGDAPYVLSIYFVPTSSTFASAVVPQLPDVIRHYVRPGRLLLKARLLGAGSPASGADAAAAGRVLQAAGLQDRFWPALVLLAQRYTGSIDGLDEAALLRDAKVPRPAAALRARSSSRVTRALARATRVAAQVGASQRRDTYIVFDASGGRADVSAAANSGHLDAGLAGALRRLARG